MSLTKTISTTAKVNATHWVIKELQWNIIDNKTRVLISGYLDQASYEDDATPLDTKIVILNGSHDETSAYSDIVNTENFTGAVDASLDD